jgi:hypothetical protein
MMNWKGCEKKQAWPNFKVLYWHLLGGTEESNQKNTVRKDSLRAEIWTRELPKTKQERQPLDHDVRYVYCDVWFI